MRIFTVLLVAVTVWVSPVLAQTTRPAKPNIIVLLADDLGSYDVGWRGSEIKTPNLDRLANGGVKLEAFYVQPICSPTRAAFMTGRYPFRYGQQNVVRPWAKTGVDLTERFLPQALKDAGYETAIAGKWHLGHQAPGYLPMQRGFDHQYGVLNGAMDYFTHERDGGLDWHRDDKALVEEGYSTTLIGKESARLIKTRDKSKPLFLYVPFNGVHAPFQAPESYKAPYTQFKAVRRTYAGMTTAVDDEVGRIMATVREEGIEGNTLIFFASDNGGPDPGRITSNGPLRGGKFTIWEGGVRTCAFFNWPGVLPAGGHVDTPMHIVDLFATFVGLAGGKTDGSKPLDSRDVWPALTGKVPSIHDVIPLNLLPRGGAIRSGEWKLVVNGGGRLGDEGDDGADGDAQVDGSDARAASKYALFNLASDPSEKTNVAAENPKVVEELAAKYAKLQKDVRPSPATPKPKNYQAPKVWGEF